MLKVGTISNLVKYLSKNCVYKMYERFGLKGLPYMLERAGLDVQQGKLL